MSKYNTEDKEILKTLIINYRKHDIIIKRIPNSIEIRDLLEKNNDYKVTAEYIRYILKHHEEKTNRTTNIVPRKMD
jgi:hypothetical protein